MWPQERSSGTIWKLGAAAGRCEVKGLVGTHGQGFTTARTWKQAERPSAYQLIRRMCYMYTHTQARMRTHTHTHTHTQWNTTQPKQMKWGCLQEHAWTSEIIILSELSQTEKGQHHKLFACGIWKRKYEWPYLQSRNKSMDIENKLMITKEERGERVKLAVWYLHTWHM